MDNNKKITEKSLHSIDPHVITANYINVPTAGWPQHTVKSPELILIIQGTFTAKFKQHKMQILPPGSVILLPTAQPCDLLRSGNEQALISCIHFELFNKQSHIKGDYQFEQPAPWIVDTKEDWRIIDLFRNCASEFTNHKPYRELLLSSILKEIWIRLIRITQGGEAVTSQRVQQMKTYIRENLQNDITRNDLAKRFSLTPEYINTIFKKETGISPTRYVNRERILLASKLITSGQHSVSQAAYEVGFKDPLYFSRVFRKEIGIPPSHLK